MKVTGEDSELLNRLVSYEREKKKKGRRKEGSEGGRKERKKKRKERKKKKKRKATLLEVSKMWSISLLPTFGN